MSRRKVGKMSEKVISALGLSLRIDAPIYLGDANISHMISRHPHDYSKYGSYISEILAHPDYVGENVKDHSIEYVKEFQIDGDFVKVAVRIAGDGVLYARSMYVLNPNRVRNFINKGTLKKV